MTARENFTEFYIACVVRTLMRVRRYQFAPRYHSSIYIICQRFTGLQMLFRSTDDWETICLCTQIYII